MKRFGMGVALSMMAVLTLAGSAVALTTMNSGFMFAVGTDNLYCSGVNIGTTPIVTFTADLVNSAGNVIASASCPNLAPAANCGVQSGSAAIARCRITLSGSKAKLRPFAEIDDTGGNTKVVFPVY